MVLRNLLIGAPGVVLATCGPGDFTGPPSVPFAVDDARAAGAMVTTGDVEHSSRDASPSGHPLGAAPSASSAASLVPAASSSNDARATEALPRVAFPIDIPRGALSLSHFDSPTSTATFGASRGAHRAHAGCDLYAKDDHGHAYKDGYYKHNKGAPIYAVMDGVVVAYEPFYAGTHAVVVDHGEVLVRYGEVSSRGLAPGVTVGARVRAGDVLAHMGDLAMASGKWAMLHFEVYSKAKQGPLSDGHNRVYLHVPKAPYLRRADLLDCRPFLRRIQQSIRASDRPLIPPP